jgi:hypothetical protein
MPGMELLFVSKNRHFVHSPVLNALKYSAYATLANSLFFPVLVVDIL